MVETRQPGTSNYPDVRRGNVRVHEAKPFVWTKTAEDILAKNRSHPCTFRTSQCNSHLILRLGA